jgi:hypothetical protein
VKCAAKSKQKRKSLFGNGSDSEGKCLQEKGRKTNDFERPTYVEKRIETDRQRKSEGKSRLPDYVTPKFVDRRIELYQSSKKRKNLMG